MNWSQAFRNVRALPWLAETDPRLKLAWLATISIGGIWLTAPWALAALTAVAAIPYLAIRMPGRAAVAYAGLLLLVSWSTVFSQALFYYAPTGDPLFTIVPAFTLQGRQYAGLHFWPEGAVYGAVQSLRFVANLLAGGSVALTTSPERLLAALVRLRIPAALSYMATAGLRSLPLAFDEWAALRQAYRLRSGRIRGGRLRLREELQLIEPLLANTLRRAATLALAVRARGFDAAAPRTHYPPLAMKPNERLALAAIGMVWLVAAAVSIYAWISSYFPLPVSFAPMIRTFVER